MKTAVAIVSLILALSIISISYADTCDSSDCTCDSSDCAPAHIFIEENDIGRLYKVELNDRPLYYYEIDTENDTIYKIVATANMHLDVSFA